MTATTPDQMTGCAVTTIGATSTAPGHIPTASEPLYVSGEAKCLVLQFLELRDGRWQWVDFDRCYDPVWFARVAAHWRQRGPLVAQNWRIIERTERVIEAITSSAS